MKNLTDVVQNNLCLGCGLCNLNLDEGSPRITLKYSSKKGYKIPVEINETSRNAKLGFSLCPGKGYSINTEARRLNFGDRFHLDLGYYDNLAAINVIKEQYREKASSSGIMISIANYLIENGLVDKVIVTKFTYGLDGVRTQTFATNSLAEMIDSQGSKYCPVDLGELIEYLKTSSKKESYVFIGTPCQIASLRDIQANIVDLNIKYFIGNFCGGFKSFNNLNRLIEIQKIIPSKVDFFRFRGGGQPGSLEIRSGSKVGNVKYPEYVKTTGYSKLKRCHLCVDATAELADFACGDAWLKEYEGKDPTSIVITRTKASTEIIEKMYLNGDLKLSDISEANVIKSQLGNISTKKYRQENRLNLYKKLWIKTPVLYEGFQKETVANLRLEVNVLISHIVKFLAEKLHLYIPFYYKNGIIKKIMFKIFKDNYN